MRSGTVGHASAWIAAVAFAGAGCGSEELFEPRLAGNERLIEREAVARLTKSDGKLQHAAVVGDLDGDGADDVVLQSSAAVRPGEPVDRSVHVYVLYGGQAVAGNIEIETLPSLTEDGLISSVFEGVAQVGDVDGDGFADFLVGRPRRGACDSAAPVPGWGGGAHVVYGRATRFAGISQLSEAGALLRSSQCTYAGLTRGLGDLDGDGRADFVIASAASRETGGLAALYIYYGTSERLTGIRDLAASADAVLRVPAKIGSYAMVISAGDVDGDGRGDFLVDSPREAGLADVRLVSGSATRLAGELALDDIARVRSAGLAQCGLEGALGGLAGGSLGDLDSDGRDDLVLVSCVGFPGLRSAQFSIQHRVFRGRAGGLPAQLRPDDADVTLTSTVGPLYMASADVDGDGLLDLVVGNPYLHDGNGAVHVIPDGARLIGGDPTAGGVAYVGRPQWTTRCEYHPGCVAAERVGTGLRIGDLTGDGRADILVDAPTEQWVSPELGVPGSALGGLYVLSLPAAEKP